MQDDEWIERLSQALFEQDPMHTCCVENDAYDEYDGVALSIARRLAQSDNLEHALAVIFQRYFEAVPDDLAGLAARIESRLQG